MLFRSGYLGGIAGVGTLANQVQTIKNNLEKGAIPAGESGEAKPVKESTVITSFSDFLKVRR